MKYKCDKEMRRSKEHRLELSKREGFSSADGWQGCDGECKNCICGMWTEDGEWSHNNYSHIDDKKKGESYGKKPTEQTLLAKERDRTD